MTSNDIAGKWLRVSTGDQDERDQEPDIERWIEDHEYATGPTYRLHGASASKGKQDKMIARVLEDMRAGRITVLVVWYSARIERRGAWDHMNLAHKAKLAGGRIEYVKEPQLNEVNAFSNTFLAMHADLNKKYSDDLSMNVRKSFDAIDANGGIRGRAIFGYRVVGDKKHKTFEFIVDAHPGGSIYFAKPADGVYGWAGADYDVWGKGVIDAIDYQTGKIRWSHELGPEGSGRSEERRGGEDKKS